MTNPTNVLPGPASLQALIPGQTAISEGPEYEQVDQFDLFSGIISIAGTTTALNPPPPPTIAVAKTVPPATKVKVIGVSVQVSSGPQNQLLWTLNLVRPLDPWNLVNAAAMQQLGIAYIQKIFDAGGDLQVLLTNISNSNYPGAATQAFSVTAQVSVTAVLLALRHRAVRMRG